MRCLSNALLGAACIGFVACARPLALNAPNVAPAKARDPTPVDLQSFAINETTAILGDFAPPGPAAVLTAAMKAELEARALHGGERGGYSVQCTLDRFAVRSRANMIESEELLLLYADLSCEARRVADGALVWRGELRGRGAADSANVLGSDTSATQRLVGRAMSDAAREMASDLALRALALVGEPSARVFADEEQQHSGAGLDDAPYGPAALQENPAAVQGAMRAPDEHDAHVRAAAWNVAAMAAGPGDAWLAGDRMKLDDDTLVRFVQYKALARLQSPVALQELRGARVKEGDALLSEFLDDALASGGIGLARSHRP